MRDADASRWQNALIVRIATDPLTWTGVGVVSHADDVRYLKLLDDIPGVRSSLRSSGEFLSIERASPDLLDAIRKHGRTIKIVEEGSEEMRYLNFIGAEANVGGETMSHILLRPNPGKAAALEEFLHGTQFKIGIIDRLGVQGAEVHVKDFMIRHQRILGLSTEDVEILRRLRDLEAQRLP